MRKTVLLLIAVSLLFSESVAAQSYYTRTFRMGFTPYPPTNDVPGYEEAYSIIQNHGDLISHTFQKGIPWEEALVSSNYRDYPASLQDHWDFLLGSDAANLPDITRYISILPTNIFYDGLAPSWTEENHSEGLSAPWNSYTFNSPDVKTALLNYAISLIDLFDPDYFGLGVEINILMAKRYDLWDGYKELHQFLYAELKSRYPDLYIFPTIQYEHMLGIHDASAALLQQLSATYPGVLWLEVYELMQNSDAFAISTFPYLSYGNHIYPGYYVHAQNLANVLDIPLAVDQMGSLSQDVEVNSITLSGSRSGQANFIYYMLLLALQQDYLFVVNFFTIDYASNYGQDPVALSWAYTGLVDPDGYAKPALDIWDLFFAIPLSPD